MKLILINVMIMLLLTVFIIPEPAKACFQAGDTDGNGKVDIFDYNDVVTDFGKTGLNLKGDLNHDGKVDIYDYNIVLTNFGKHC